MSEQRIEALIKRMEALVTRIEDAQRTNRAIPGTAKEEVSWDTGKST